MKECAAQADRVAHRARLDSDPNVLGRRNHYSPKYGRCYLEVSFVNADAKKKPESLPLLYYELWDAFEGKLLGTCTDGVVSGNGMFCNIEDDGRGFVPCDVCREFVKERMTK